MSDITESGHRSTATAVVHESYSFACMRCGHGWEQSYAIEHHRDAGGHEFVVYTTDGHTVPSPLSRPGCPNCGGHVVRIMRAGRVSSVRESMRGQHLGARGVAGPLGEPTGPRVPGARRQHHWHLADLLHPFRRNH